MVLGSPAMKSTKSPRIGLSHRSRSSRTTDTQPPQPSPTHPRRPSLTTPDQRDSYPHASRMDAPPGDSGPARAPPVEDAAEMENMRRRMSEALALKQLHMTTSSSAPSGTRAATGPLAGARATSALPTQQGSDKSLASGTISTDSAKTIKAGFDMTPGTARTPSYPFPRMRLNLHRGTSHRSAPSHKPFTLLSPTVTPLQEGDANTIYSAQPASSELSTPVGQRPADVPTAFDDSNFPTPDLYDMVLVLNSEPGLDAWWANTAQILAEAFGAERSSLAVPTDVTDHENVPWGQKATFNLYGTNGSSFSHRGSSSVSEFDLIPAGGRPERQNTTAEQAPAPAPQRPPLQTRHSIAGAIPEPTQRSSRQRPPGPPRATSNITGQHEEQEVSSTSPRISRQPQRRESSGTLDSPTPKQFNDSASVSSTLRCYVHRSIQPLEQEEDPLLIRTGVAGLFGKRRPVVLTRAYNDEGPVPEHTPRDDIKSRPRATSTIGIPASYDDSGPRLRLLRAFNEYEQPEPSPWSLSPAPSPAARPDPSESPFFAQAANIDESAFEQNPPNYDYAATANQSLEAIGADTSKTLIHIPLIQLVPSRGILASTLRFPVAILSMLSPINPYPANLRQSLTKLIPHLASSYSLAQQFSDLQNRIRGHGSGGHGATFGLGGTFSDQGSELELVAELSEQIARDKGKERAERSRHNVNTPSDRASSSSRSLPGSAIGTPMLEHYGFAAGSVNTPGRSGTEMVDSYFSAKRQKGGSGIQATTPGGQTLSEDSPDKSRKKGQSTTRSGSRKVAISSPKLREDPPAPAAPRSASVASESDNGDHHQFLMPERSDTGSFRRPSHQQESPLVEKPLPELISQLMLNSVPLQLFLAKPKSGDLVWTNRKFDAFRSQGEERVRDPWKNIHPSERASLVQDWTEALKSGSQFMHYVRVKRFNSDSDFRWFIFRASTLLASNGRLLYWIGSFMDVHEQYIKSIDANERAATVARDAKLRALADSIPQILFEAVEGEGIVAVNQQWQAFSGQTLEDARGLGFARQVHREDLHKCGVLSPSDDALTSKPSYAQKSPSDSSGSTNRTATALPVPKPTFWQISDSVPLEKLVEQGVISIEKDENGRVFYSTEIRLRSKGGEFRWFLVRLVKVESELINNGVSSWYGTCTDIDVRKGLERELNRANKKVHQEMESKTKFFANMSHEIRTPLNGILGSMPWLVESQLDHDQRRTVDVIQNSSNNLRELVDNILDVTKVEAGKMNLVYKWFHVRTLLEEIIDTISSRAIERGLELNYTIDANVPSSVKGDPFRLRQVLLNLMGNSVKFTEQGEVYTRCSLNVGDSTDTSDSNSIMLLFEVMDTGRGFNPAEFQRIFQQFGQIDGGSSHDAGSGLGLFLSKQLVEMHGGHLSAKSKAGEGSIFSFYIKVEVLPPGATVETAPIPASRPMSYRSTASYGTNPRTRSESKTPAMAMGRAAQSVLPSPGRQVTSPDIQSPAVVSSGSSDPSIRSQSINLVRQSSASSMMRTPESSGSAIAAGGLTERQELAEKAMAALPALKRSRSDNDGSGLAPDKAFPLTYSIMVICPAEYARAAIKQHIEQVVPHQIAANVTTISDIGSFIDLVQGPTSSTFTHIVLDIPASSDVMLFLRQMANFTAAVIPTVVLITDHYQKRDILEDFEALKASGRQAHMIHKPVKPAVFAMIFDPSQLRNLSKDAARSMAQTNTDNFKNTAERVKSAIGNKSFRVLLVEDSDTNRKVILRYLTKVELLAETATNGEECTEMVLSKPHGYYSLIICDIQMPKKNGYEACSELRQWETANRYPPTPIMALTANAMPEERAAAARAGFTDYLTKPVHYNLLGTMMMMLLDARMPHIFLRDRPPES